MSTPGTVGSFRPLVTAGTVLGIGMGGFIDGILFHQILQLHNMLSARVSPETLLGAKINMVWDGIFHAGVWTATAIGIALLWRAVRRPGARLSGRVLIGAMILGWGLFNLVEGLIDHHILRIHHVYERLGQSVWDYVFLGFGALLVAVGWLIIRREARA
jgi:uncharacterized membrane protein